MSCYSLWTDNEKKSCYIDNPPRDNFGAMLQAYSLVMACRELGADAQIIDRRNPFLRRKGDFFNKKNDARNCSYL